MTIAYAIATPSTDPAIALREIAAVGAEEQADPRMTNNKKAEPRTRHVAIALVVALAREVVSSGAVAWAAWLGMLVALAVGEAGV